MFDRKRAEQVFLEYAAGYDRNDRKISLKIYHTLRVAELSDRIARSLAFSREETDLAWFLGLLHDIGRFEQVRIYGTFIDRDSVDHAELGADILFRDHLIGRFETEGLPAGWMETAETAVRNHNKLNLPEHLDKTVRQYCNLLRDADKADIFRVISEVPFAERAGSRARWSGTLPASDEVMHCVSMHSCVPRAVVRSEFETRISHCCMAFELVFDETRKIVREQGYLAELLAGRDLPEDAAFTELQSRQMDVLRKELSAAGILL